MTKILYTAKDAGCYADGCRGYAEQRTMLARLLRNAAELVPSLYYNTYSGRIPIGEINEALLDSMSDDDWETEAALDRLNEVTQGATWQFVDGDLMLVSDEEEG